MGYDDECTDADDTLAYLRSNTYNINRPDSIVIAELVQVIRLLDTRLRTVEENFGIAS